MVFSWWLGLFVSIRSGGRTIVAAGDEWANLPATAYSAADV
jgi:hypothetical protein